MLRCLTLILFLFMTVPVAAQDLTGNTAIITYSGKGMQDFTIYASFTSEAVLLHTGGRSSGAACGLQKAVTQSFRCTKRSINSCGGVFSDWLGRWDIENIRSDMTLKCVAKRSGDKYTLDLDMLLVTDKSDGPLTSRWADRYTIDPDQRGGCRSDYRRDAEFSVGEDFKVRGKSVFCAIREGL